MLKKLLCSLWLALALNTAINRAASQTPAPPTQERTWQQAALAEIQNRLAGREKELAERVFKNIEVLKGKEAARLPGMMVALTGLLGVDCAYCHVRDQWEKEDKPAKQITRQHFQMQARLNKEFFAGQNAITCWTCHRRQPKPEKAK
ncbi:MAG: photosynthetic reaction center cytochrome c subunit [Acidobacteria bacterium]|nr:photosynthetic reaction center cytochrome c subunit [Acidobacteriota bacterium]